MTKFVLEAEAGVLSSHSMLFQAQRSESIRATRAQSQYWNDSAGFTAMRTHTSCFWPRCTLQAISVEPC